MTNKLLYKLLFIFIKYYYYKQYNIKYILYYKNKLLLITFNNFFYYNTRLYIMLKLSLFFFITYSNLNRKLLYNNYTNYIATSNVTKDNILYFSYSIYLYHIKLNYNNNYNIKIENNNYICMLYPIYFNCIINNKNLRAKNKKLRFFYLRFFKKYKLYFKNISSVLNLHFKTHFILDLIFNAKKSFNYTIIKKKKKKRWKFKRVKIFNNILNYSININFLFIFNNMVGLFFKKKYFHNNNRNKGLTSPFHNYNNESFFNSYKKLKHIENKNYNFRNILTNICFFYTYLKFSPQSLLYFSFYKNFYYNSSIFVYYLQFLINNIVTINFKYYRITSKNSVVPYGFKFVNRKRFFFLNKLDFFDLYRIIILIFKTGDIFLLKLWIKSAFKRVSFKKHKLLCYLLRFYLKRLFFVYRRYTYCVGLYLRLKGKISVGGNSRKRSFIVKLGKRSFTQKALKIYYTDFFLLTETGILGVKYLFSYS